MSSCVTDSESIDLTVSGGQLEADLIVSPADGIVPNGLTVESDGVFVNTDGWVPLPAVLAQLGGNVGNTYYLSTSINLSTLITPGQALKFTQNGTVHYFTVMIVASNQLTVHLQDGSSINTSAVTLPYFSLKGAPSSMKGVGPLVVNTGDDFFAFYYDGTSWSTRSMPVWASANAAALTRSANTYLNMTAAGYASQQLPFRLAVADGFTWQFRWTGGVTYGASQSAAGIRLTAVVADLFGTGGVQDTSNVFGEVLTFAAGAERFQDSGWVALNPSVAIKDMLTIMPQFKSDGTRTVTISQLDPFCVRGRLVL